MAKIITISQLIIVCFDTGTKEIIGNVGNFFRIINETE